ncbi:MAG: hypothetical protein AB8G11_21995 [Saprospiraceae bacterium]
MLKHFNLNKLLIVGVPLLLILSMFLLAKSAAFHQNPDTLSLAITLDLLITVPLVYFLLIRKKNIPKYTVVSAFIIGIIAATFILPESNQYYLSQIKFWVVPVLELTIFTIVFSKLRKTFKAVKAEKQTTPDFYSAVIKATKEVLPPRVSSVFATEISVIYYSLHWSPRFRDKRKPKIQENEFAYHRRGGVREVLSVLMLAIVAETIAIHLLLAQWSLVAAWILTFLSIYTFFQVVGIIRSMPRRPIKIENGNLYLRYGLFNDTTIPLMDIEEIKLERKGLEFDNDTRMLSGLGEIDSYNVVLHLKNRHTMSGLYGFTKTFTTIAFHVDDKERFEAALRVACNGNTDLTD